MSRVKEEIIARYPALRTELAVLSVEEASDLRFMSELASRIVDLFEIGETPSVRPAFQLAEQLLASPIEAERNAAVLGFLETVQNVASHRECGMTAFEEFLQPKTRIAWNQLLEVWREKTSLAEVVAAETGAKLNPPWWRFWRRRKRSSTKDFLDEVENPELRRIIEQITRQ